MLRGALVLGLLLAGGPGSAGDTDLVRQVDDRLAFGDIIGARELLSIAPEGEAATHVARAHLLIETDPGNLGDIRAELEAAERIDPSSRSTILLLAARLRDSGAFEDAEAVLYRGLERFPDDPSLLQGVASVRMAQGQPGPAARLLQKAVQRAPSDTSIQRDLGLAWAAAGSPAQALLFLQDARERVPDDLAVRSALVEIYRQLNDAPHSTAEREAVTRIRALLAHDQARREALEALSARIAEMEAVAAGPEPPPGTFVQLVRLYDRRSDTAWSLPRLARLAARHDSPEARAAGVLARPSDPGSMADLRAVLAVDPTNLLALEAMLRLPASTIPAAERLAACRRAVESSPGDAVLLAYLGRALAATGDPQEGAGTLRKALEMEPTTYQAALWLAELMRSAGHAEEAKGVLNRAIEAGAQEPELLLALGFTSLALEDWSGAWDALLQAQDRGVRHPQLFATLGSLAARQGNQVAAAAYDRAASDRPSEPETR